MPLSVLQTLLSRARVALGAGEEGNSLPSAWLCTTCGVQFPPSTPPAHCPICEDERQHVGSGGQRWTTLGELRRTHRNVFTTEEPGLLSIRTEPIFGIGQRALLVQTPQGNVLWDCISLIDGATVETLRDKGGVSALAISHPHFYASMVDLRTEAKRSLERSALRHVRALRGEHDVVAW